MNKHNVLKLDSDSVKELRKDLYEPDPSKKEEALVDTRFSCPISKYSAGTHMKMKLEQTQAGEGKINYIASKKFDALFQLKAHTKLPYIKVKDKFSESVSICYVHNLMHNILYAGELKIDDDHIESLDSVYVDNKCQYFVTKTDLYDKSIGNIECLEEWSRELPSLPLSFPQPFSFFRKTNVSLPLLKSNNNVVFEYKVRTKLSELLRMRVAKKDEKTGQIHYKEIKCNLKYLDIKGKEENIPIPEMWGRYAELTDAEVNWKKSEEGRQTIYIEDVYSTCSKNPIPMGSTDIIPLDCPYPSKYMYWTASLVNNDNQPACLSNYSTNREDVYKGWNPCAKACIKYGGSDRVEEMGYEHFEFSEAYDFDFPSAPREPGYNLYVFSFEPRRINPSDNLVILKNCKAELNVTLGDTNPFLIKNDEDEYYDDNNQAIPIEALEDDEHAKSQREKYIVHVRVVFTRRLEVFWDNKANKLKYVFT